MERLHFYLEIFELVGEAQQMIFYDQSLQYFIVLGQSAHWKRPHTFLEIQAYFSSYSVSWYSAIHFRIYRPALMKLTAHTPPPSTKRDYISRRQSLDNSSAQDTGAPLSSHPEHFKKTWPKQLHHFDEFVLYDLTHWAKHSPLLCQGCSVLPTPKRSKLMSQASKNHEIGLGTHEI